jgi:hypothetical protein
MQPSLAGPGPYLDAACCPLDSTAATPTGCCPAVCSQQPDGIVLRMVGMLCAHTGMTGPSYPSPPPLPLLSGATSTSHCSTLACTGDTTRWVC